MESLVHCQPRDRNPWAIRVFFVLPENLTKNMMLPACSTDVYTTPAVISTIKLIQCYHRSA